MSVDLLPSFRDAKGLPDPRARRASQVSRDPRVFVDRSARPGLRATPAHLASPAQWENQASKGPRATPARTATTVRSESKVPPGNPAPPARWVCQASTESRYDQQLAFLLLYHYLAILLSLYKCYYLRANPHVSVLFIFAYTLCFVLESICIHCNIFSSPLVVICPASKFVMKVSCRHHTYAGFELSLILTAKVPGVICRAIHVHRSPSFPGS